MHQVERAHHKRLQKKAHLPQDPKVNVRSLKHVIFLIVSDNNYNFSQPLGFVNHNKKLHEMDKKTAIIKVSLYPGKLSTPHEDLFISCNSDQV